MGRLSDSWSESLCVGCVMEELGKAVAVGKDKLLCAARFPLQTPWCSVRANHWEHEHNSKLTGGSSADNC